MSTTTSLGFIVPVDADAPDGPTQIGGNATKADELAQAGGVAKRFWSGAELTRASATMGSFSTPIKVEIPVVKANQWVEIEMLIFVLGAATPPTIGLRYEGAAVGAGTLAVADKAVWTTAEYLGYTFGLLSDIQPISPTGVPPAEIASAISAFEGATIPLSLSTNHAPLVLKHKNAESKPVAIEVQGKIASGAAKIRGAWLAARVHG